MTKCLICLLWLPLLLTACAQQPVPISQQSWSDHSRQVALIRTWSIAGKAGIKTVAKSGSLRLNWRQQNDFFQIHFFNAFGQQLASIEGTAENAQLVTEGADQSAQNLQDSLSQMGWDVPMAQMQFWIKGLPAPGQYELSLNQQQLAENLRQEGWLIEYLDYQNLSSGLALPSKIKLQNGQGQLTLIINQWSLSL